MMTVIEVHSLTVREPGKVVLQDLAFTMQQGEQWAVVGPSGSGKTTLLLAVAGRHAHSGTITVNDAAGKTAKMVMITQQHRFRTLSNTTNFYYQQRYNSADAEDAITVKEDLQRCMPANTDTRSTAEMDEITTLLRLNGLLEEKLIQLSNGENKRLQVAKALLLHPTILLLDSPFTGLDEAARATLTDLLQRITAKGIHILLATTPGGVPPFITHVLELDKEGKCRTGTAAAFRLSQSSQVEHAAFVPDKQLLSKLAGTAVDDPFEFTVRMKAVTIRYNNRLVLDNVSWTIRKGERWALSGPNGAGKSTLLSLINADNPQAYANEVCLFDRRRGTGESIWDIKKRIGFVSPELHLYFDTAANCFDVVASGLFDTVGLFRQINAAQSALVEEWMRLLQVHHLRSRLLLQLSNSEQRLVLLARALVKNPPLLIFDEPCQGLDDDQVALFKTMVDAICVGTGKSLIYVSHYPREIPSCVKHFLQLKDGRVV